MKSHITALMGFVVLFLVAGCDKESNPVDAGSVGTYVGNFIGVDTTAGLVIINVQASGSVNGYAVLWEDSVTTVSITGNISNNAFTGSASDGTPLVATLSGTTITGTANNGQAAYTLTLANGPVTMLKYAGSFTSTTGPSESGTLHIRTAATTMWGVIIDSGGTANPGFLVGTIAGNVISARDASDPGTEVATGTLTGSTWSGTYTGDQSSGTWAVTLIP